MNTLKILLSIFSLVLLLLSTGCGGGGNGAVYQAAITGTASQGAPLPAGTPVYLKDANGTERSGIILDSQGTYTISVDGLTAPFVIKAGSFYTFATGSGTVNVNPLTTLCMQTVVGVDLAAFYGNSGAPLRTDGLNNLISRFQTTVASLKSQLDAAYSLDVPATQRDFLAGAVVIDQGVDKLLHNIDIVSGETGFIIKNKVGGTTLVSGSRLDDGTYTLTTNATAIAQFGISYFPPPSATGPRLTIVPIASDTYSIQADDLNGVAAFDLNINYNTSILSSPTVTSGSLTATGLMVANTNNPGQIRIAVISTTGFSGSGSVAVIKFAGQTGSNGVTIFTASTVDSVGKPLPVKALILRIQ